MWLFCCRQLALLLQQVEVYVRVDTRHVNSHMQAHTTDSQHGHSNCTEASFYTCTLECTCMSMPHQTHVHTYAHRHTFGSHSDTCHTHGQIHYTSRSHMQTGVHIYACMNIQTWSGLGLHIGDVQSRATRIYPTRSSKFQYPLIDYKLCSEYMPYWNTTAEITSAYCIKI